MTQVRVSFPGRMGRQAQTQFGEYELKKMLGEGASGKVYLALDTYAGAEVTLKVIDARVLQDSEVGELTREQFMNEATLAGKLTHTHIVSILEAVMGEDSGYVAMGYALGDDLNRFTKPKSVTRRLARMTAVGVRRAKAALSSG
jgi:serine/threonine protein kinase